MKPAAKIFNLLLFMGLFAIYAQPAWAGGYFYFSSGNHHYGNGHSSFGYGYSSYPTYKHAHRFPFKGRRHHRRHYKSHPNKHHGYGHEYRRRHHHKHIRHLPFHAKRISVGGKSYYYNKGVFYKRCRGEYDVVPAPRGACVRRLPVGYKFYYHEGKKHYKYRDTHYVRTPDGYLVVDAPDYHVSHKRW